jgi:hypothetical protein
MSTNSTRKDKGGPQSMFKTNSSSWIRFFERREEGCTETSQENEDDDIRARDILNPYSDFTNLFNTNATRIEQ